MKKIFYIFVLSSLIMQAMDKTKSDLILPAIHRQTQKTVQQKTIKLAQKKIKVQKTSLSIKARIRINDELVVVRGFTQSLSKAKTLQALTLMSPRTLSVFEKPKFSTSSHDF